MMNNLKWVEYNFVTSICGQSLRFWIKFWVTIKYSISWSNIEQINNKKIAENFHKLNEIPLRLKQEIFNKSAQHLRICCSLPLRVPCEKPRKTSRMIYSRIIWIQDKLSYRLREEKKVFPLNELENN